MPQNYWCLLRRLPPGQLGEKHWRRERDHLALSYPVLVSAQVFLGVWLGAVFDRDLLRNAQGFIPGAILASILLIFLCLEMGLLLSWLTGQSWQVMVLSTAPGSVTDMALTAKILQ